MIQLPNDQYYKVYHLIIRDNDLSPLSVVNGEIDGEIYVNENNNPSSVLIKTSEVRYLAGDTNDENFNAELQSKFDFWDNATPDSEEWRLMIPKVHENKFIREYTRRKNTLVENNFILSRVKLPVGYFIEQFNKSNLKEHAYENNQKLFEWSEGWGDEDAFPNAGYGFYIRNENKIVSWALSDCTYKDNIEIGVTTDEGYKRKGFGELVTSTLIEYCFELGYKSISWLCVDTNKGSIAVAEKLGFQLRNKYQSFSSYAPIENYTDLNESGWYDWGQYLDNASQQESRLYWECLSCYIKANAVDETIYIIEQMISKGVSIYLEALKTNIQWLLKRGYCSDFSKPKWVEYHDALEERLKR